MARKNVTIRELRLAAKRLEWTNVHVTVYRSPIAKVYWRCDVSGLLRGNKYATEFVGVGFNSRQGAMGMALAALRAK
jgi:hypothetical protein